MRRETSVSAGALLGAGDGAHSIRVAGAAGDAVHLTTVTVHLPHTHRPVLKTRYDMVIIIRSHASVESHCFLHFCSLSAVLLDCALTRAHLRTACEQKALFEHVQREDSICGR